MTEMSTCTFVASSVFSFLVLGDSNLHKVRVSFPVQLGVDFQALRPVCLPVFIDEDDLAARGQSCA